MNKYTFVTSAGLEVSFTPPSAEQIELSERGIRQEFAERGEVVEPPTYTVELAGSTPENPVTQTFEHDEKSLKTDEDRAAWEAYLKGSTHLKEVMGENNTLMVLEALNVQLPSDDTWEKRQARHHIKIPQDPEEKLLHYKKTEVLRTTEDIYMAISKIITSAYAGSTSDEALDVASKLFRDKLQEAALENANQTGRSAGRRGSQGKVDAQ